MYTVLTANYYESVLKTYSYPNTTTKDDYIKHLPTTSYLYKMILDCKKVACEEMKTTPVIVKHKNNFTR